MHNLICFKGSRQNDDNIKENILDWGALFFVQRQINPVWRTQERKKTTKKSKQWHYFKWSANELRRVKGSPSSVSFLIINKRPLSNKQKQLCHIRYVDTSPISSLFSRMCSDLLTPKDLCDLISPQMCCRYSFLHTGILGPRDYSDQKLHMALYNSICWLRHVHICKSKRTAWSSELHQFPEQIWVSVQPQPLRAVTHQTALLIFNYYFVITWYTKDTHSSFICVYFFMSQMCSTNVWKSLSCRIRPTLRTTKTF